MSAERFIDRLAALVPPPRVNTLLYGGLFAANARLRPEAVGYRRPGIIARKRARPSKPSKPRNTEWAELMRHSFGLDVLACPHCGGRMRHVATVLNHASIQRILRHEGLDNPEPRARSPRPRAGAGVLGRHARTRGRRGLARRRPLPRRDALSASRAEARSSRTRFTERIPQYAVGHKHRPIHNLVISNVPGPQVPIYLAGAKLVAVYPMGPVMEGAGLNITVMSYDGHVDFGFRVAADLVPNVWSLSAGVKPAYEELRNAK